MPDTDKGKRQKALVVKGFLGYPVASFYPTEKEGIYWDSASGNTITLEEIKQKYSGGGIVSLTLDEMPEEQLLLYNAGLSDIENPTDEQKLSLMRMSELQLRFGGGMMVQLGAWSQGIDRFTLQKINKTFSNVQRNLATQRATDANFDKILKAMGETGGGFDFSKPADQKRVRDLLATWYNELHPNKAYNPNNIGDEDVQVIETAIKALESGDKEQFQKIFEGAGDIKKAFEYVNPLVKVTPPEVSGQKIEDFEILKQQTMAEAKAKILEQINAQLPDMNEKAKANLASVMSHIYETGQFEKGGLPVENTLVGALTKTQQKGGGFEYGSTPNVEGFLNEYSPVKVANMILGRFSTYATAKPEELKALGEELAKKKPEDLTGFGAIRGAAFESIGRVYEAQSERQVREAMGKTYTTPSGIRSTGEPGQFETTTRERTFGELNPEEQEKALAGAKESAKEAEKYGVGGAAPGPTTSRGRPIPMPEQIEAQREPGQQDFWNFLLEQFPGQNVTTAYRQFPLIFEDWKKTVGNETTGWDDQVTEFIKKKGRSFFAPFVREIPPEQGIQSPQKGRAQLRMR